MLGFFSLQLTHIPVILVAKLALLFPQTLRQSSQILIIKSQLERKNPSTQNVFI